MASVHEVNDDIVDASAKRNVRALARRRALDDEQ
jgi:hypothetical protein